MFVTVTHSVRARIHASRFERAVNVLRIASKEGCTSPVSNANDGSDEVDDASLNELL